jgi:hypothetical protein
MSHLAPLALNNPASNPMAPFLFVICIYFVYFKSHFIFPDASVPALKCNDCHAVGHVVCSK